MPPVVLLPECRATFAAFADLMDKLGDTMAETYAGRTGRSKQEITAMMEAENLGWMAMSVRLTASQMRLYPRLRNGPN